MCKNTLKIDEKLQRTDSERNESVIIFFLLCPVHTGEMLRQEQVDIQCHGFCCGYYVFRSTRLRISKF